MAAGIEIDGKRYKVIESMGYNHDIGCYAKIVVDGERERMAVKQAATWRFWSAADRVSPLVEAIKHGMTNELRRRAAVAGCGEADCHAD